MKNEITNHKIAFFNGCEKTIRDFYVFWHVTEKTEKDFPCEPIRTIQDFKRELIKKIEMDREDDFIGWDPEDYTTPNIVEFNSEYDAKFGFIEQANLQELIQFVGDMENRIILTHEHPSKLTEYDFEFDDNPKFVRLENMTEY